LFTPIFIAYRLCHINETRITKLHKEWYFDHFDYVSYETCEVCLLSKMIKTHFTRKGKRSKKLLGLIQIDVCGSMMICVISGYTDFITFTNDHSRYSYVCLMKHNS
jgi:hypothetical protein